MDALLQDVRYAMRVLAQRPGFTAIAVLTLAVGIGAMTTVFSAVDGVLLRPLPFDAPHRIVSISRVHMQRNIEVTSTSAATFWDWKDRNDVFEALAGYLPVNTTLVVDDGASRVCGALVSAEFFSVLGVNPLLGRTFSAADQTPESNATIISYRLWQTTYGGDPNVLGREIVEHGSVRTIVGVMPADFDFPRGGPTADGVAPADVWRPLAIERTTQHRLNRDCLTIARLKPGVKLGQAQANMRQVSQALAEDYPSVSGWSAKLIPLHEEIVGDMRRPLLVLFGAVGLVLLVACANVANLLLTRAGARDKEVAVRTALGARRSRIIRQFLVESSILGCLGGALGALLAICGTSLVVALSPDNLPRIHDVHVDLRVLAFAVLLLPLVAVLCGLTSALHASNCPVGAALKEGAGTSRSRVGRRWHGALVVSEIALSVILLIGAGLLIKSRGYLQTIEPGLDAENILTMRIDPAPAYHPDLTGAAAFYGRLRSRLEALSCVDSVALTSSIPMRGMTWDDTLEREGSPIVDEDGQPVIARLQVISPNYHRVVGQRLIRGRLLKEDDADRINNAIINEALARKYWYGRNPIGASFTWGGNPLRIVGVVSNVRQMGLKQDIPPEIYVPFARLSGLRPRNLIVRTTVKPESAVAAIRREVTALDPRTPVFDVKSMGTIISDLSSRDRFMMFLLTVFAGVATFLASIGIYGVVSYSVSQRTYEIGIRIAVGATAARIVMLVLRQGVRLILLGVVLGLVGAFALSRVMTSLLFGVSATDPSVFTAMAALAALVALAACCLPARRAAQVDPTVALRQG